MAMNFPLYQLDAFGGPTAKVLAIVLGILFGVALERNGFGRATNLVAQFYGRDNRVLKVMFSAIVTALVGMSVLRVAGVLDMSAMVVPATFLYPMIVGGFLLGVGFAISGYCPGTSVVAMASRKLDGLFTILGVALGSLVFGFAYPLVKPFFLSGDMGPIRLPELLNVPEPVLVLAVFAMAVGAFLGAEVLEKKIAAKNHTDAPVSVRGLRNAVLIGLGVFTLMSFTPVAEKPVPTKETVKVTQMDPWTLARTIVKDPSSLEILCLKAKVPSVVIRGAQRPAEGVTLKEYVEALPGTQTLVLVLDEDALTPYEQLATYPGRVTRLAGSYAAFAKLFLTEPTLTDDSSPEDIWTFDERYALYRFLTGAKPSGAPVPKRKPKKVQRKLKKEGGCG
jgi:uncharacterized membrane protein YedE/YeeE